MNSAKKLAKNDGIGTKMEGSVNANPIISSKNKILLIIGIVVMLVLGAGVCYMQLRPRAILNVTRTGSDGSTKKDTVYIKDAVYNIYQTETQYNMYGQIYQQMYGKTYWEMEDVDGKGRSGAAAAKKEVMNTLKQREILCMEAEANNVTLTDEEKKQAAKNAEDAMKNMTDGQKKLDGLDLESITNVLERDALAQKYRQVIIQQGGLDEAALKATVKKDDYRQYTVQYYTISNKDEEGKDVSADQKKKNLSAIKDLAKKAKSADDFSKLVEEKDESGIAAMQTQKLVEKDLKDSTFLDEKARKKVVKMKNGDISEVLEAGDAYYVVRMENNDDSEAYDTECDKVVDEEKNKIVSTKLAELASSYEFEVQPYWKGRVKLGAYTTVE